MSKAYPWVEPPWPEDPLPRDELEARIVQLIGQHNTCVLATNRKDGHPIIRANGDMTEYEAVWLCEWAKHIVLKMAEEEAAEGE